MDGGWSAVEPGGAKRNKTAFFSALVNIINFEEGESVWGRVMYAENIDSDVLQLSNYLLGWSKLSLQTIH